MRRLSRFASLGPGNSLWYWNRTVSPWRVTRNFLIISIARYLPWLWLKNVLYRSLGMHIGKRVSVGLAVMFDIFFPELITIGDDAIIGYNCTILAHEYLQKEYRTGRVEIARGSMLGANTTVLPGVRIGEGAIVSACTLVNRDVVPGAFAGGVPVRALHARLGSLQTRAYSPPNLHLLRDYRREDGHVKHDS